MAKVKAIGQRGSWFADVDGERLPCVHQHWVAGNRYHDPQAIPGEKKWDELIGAIRRGRVILTKDKVSADQRSFKRRGYVAVFAVDDVKVYGNDLTFRLANRISELV
ncbi:hypothetical protein FHW79_001657 [Azospirillum sp. OGB3]|uniref:hypothetical protein n=1 Tax=Azospirillum sp. OGB3 TaxID=2587012 RepID=UPI001606A33F|nr:hypothetical protein [Azospirillum sp. OGB3]MBB3264042.1 hypothetical protein [Azospirillum sp. OGB3]